MRGKASVVGDTRISPNGYHYTRTVEGWQLTHRIKVEKRLGRKLRANERVKFLDGNKLNLEHDNLEVIIAKSSTLEARKAKVQARIDELQAELDELETLAIEEDSRQEERLS